MWSICSMITSNCFINIVKVALVVSHAWGQDMSLYCEFLRGSLSIAVSGCLEYWCLRLWGVQMAKYCGSGLNIMKLSIIRCIWE